MHVDLSLKEMEKKQMLTVGELKAILQNHSDDTPIAVSVDNQSKPRDIVRVGYLVTNRHNDSNILTHTIGLFLYDD
jgi:hypothetical protein